jgi:hypothetical protein
VLRRFIAVNGVPVEHGWIDKGPQKGWNPVAANKLLPNEERQPMHPVKVQPQPLAGTPSFKDVRANTVAPADQRVIYHGYVPASSREKYLTPVANAAQLIQDQIMNPPATVTPPTDPRLDEVTARVIEAWFQIFEFNTTLPPSRYPPDKPDPVKPAREEISLFILLDLGDFLQKKLAEVFNALTSTSGANLPNDGTYVQRQALLDELRKITVTFYKNGDQTQMDSNFALSQAITQLRPFLGLAQGQGNEPSDVYDVSLGHTSAFIDVNYLAPPGPYPPNLPQPPNLPPGQNGGRLYNLFANALAEDRSNKKNWLTVPPELTEVIKAEPEMGDVFFLRLVYEHAPCDTVLSDTTSAFTFAKFFDPDAPARPIRIELPSIRPKDLRKYKRGVGLQFSPELKNLVNRVNTGMLQNNGPLSPADPNVNLSIAFICSFAIPITFLVAIIVMFIFLILLNIIFWWLPFIFICFPIPKRK